jgi:NhaP-type Na+/H+ or K+/H+ antiporter
MIRSDPFRAKAGRRGDETRSLFWRAYFGILLGVTLGLWLWIIVDDFV